MTTIITKLVQDGNSMAVRIPKTMLTMSGLSGTIRMEAKNGQVTLRPALSPRAGWRRQIRQELQAHGPLVATDRYGNLSTEADATLLDGLSEEPLSINSGTLRTFKE